MRPWRSCNASSGCASCRRPPAAACHLPAPANRRHSCAISLACISCQPLLTASLGMQDFEPSALSTLLHAAGTTTAKTTQFARVACLRLAACCTQQERCLQWRAMLAPPLLPKLLGLLSRALHDPDSAVRGAAAEGFGVVACQLAVAHPGRSELTGMHQLVSPSC